MLSLLPAWPLAVLVLLIALGVWQSRPRVVSPGAQLAWLVAVAASVFLGRGVFGPSAVTRVPGSTTIRLAGSWLPLALMLGIFAAKFIVGVVEGTRLPVGQAPWFAPVVSFFLGTLNGGPRAHSSFGAFLAVQQPMPDPSNVLTTHGPSRLRQAAALHRQRHP